MARYTSTIVTDEGTPGVPLAGTLVSVLASSGQLAALTDDNGYALQNPITIGSLGLLEFNIPNPGDECLLQYRYGGRLVREDVALIGLPPAFIGPPGLPANTYTSYAALLASDPTRKVAQLVGDTDTIPHADGTFSYVDGTGWVRQSATALAYGAGSVADALAAGVASATNVPFADAATLHEDMEPFPLMRPNAAVMAAIASGTLNICVVMDSTGQPAGIAYPNGIAENLQRLFTTMFPSLTVNVVNLSIPGRDISQLASSSYTAINIAATPRDLNTSYWPGGSIPGKTWRDHVRDSFTGGPDIVIPGLVLNGFLDSVPYSVYFNDPNPAQSIYAYSQTWTTKPWFVNLLALIPEGTAQNQMQIQSINDFLRYTAIKNGFGIIDAESPFRLLRSGTRRELVPWYLETDFAGFGDTTKWQVNPSLTLSGTTLTGTGTATRIVNTRDFDVSFQITRTTTNCVYLVNGRTRTEGAYSVQGNFADRYARLYFRGTLVSAGIQFPAIAVGATTTVRVKADRDRLFVYHDGQLINSYQSPVGMDAGAIVVGFAGDVGSMTAANIAMAPEYQAAQPYFSAAYMLNDGLHHPTAEGEYQSYIPAAKKFVDEFAAIVRQPMTLSASDATDVTYPTTGIQILATPALTFTLAAPKTVSVRIRFGYKNSNTSAGTLTLRLDATGVDTVFLPPTTGANNSQLSYSVDVPLGAGTHTLDLVETAPTGATAGITSIGGGNLRAMSASVSVL